MSPGREEWEMVLCTMALGRLMLPSFHDSAGPTQAGVVALALRTLSCESIHSLSVADRPIPQLGFSFWSLGYVKGVMGHISTMAETSANPPPQQPSAITSVQPFFTNARDYHLSVGLHSCPSPMQRGQMSFPTHKSITLVSLQKVLYRFPIYLQTMVFLFFCLYLSPPIFTLTSNANYKKKSHL